MKYKLEMEYSPVSLGYFLITNVESLRDDAILTKLIKLCKSGEISMIAADEIHKCFEKVYGCYFDRRYACRFCRLWKKC